MLEVTGSTIHLPGSRDLLGEILRRGAQQFLTQAIEAEVAEWIDGHQQVRDKQGRRQVVRNGYLPERKLVTPVGEPCRPDDSGPPTRVTGSNPRAGNSKMIRATQRWAAAGKSAKPIGGPWGKS